MFTIRITFNTSQNPAYGIHNKISLNFKNQLSFIYMENNKNFSEGFLNKLLESAIEYYNINVDNNSIKNKHSDVITAINSYKNALKFEAHKSMQKEILKDSDPILHAINLNSTPGIISGKTKDKYTVYKKYKIKKEKTAEQIEKEIIRAKERLEKRELLKLEKDKEKEIIKDKRTEIKDDKTSLKQIEKNTNKSRMLLRSRLHVFLFSASTIFEDKKLPI